MPTPPPESPVETETLEEIASKITRRWGSQYRTQLSAAILSALRNERARCERIAKVIPDNKFDLDHEPARTEQQIRNDIAAAIREGKE